VTTRTPTGRARGNNGWRVVAGDRSHDGRPVVRSTGDSRTDVRADEGPARRRSRPQPRYHATDRRRSSDPTRPDQIRTPGRRPRGGPTARVGADWRPPAVTAFVGAAEDPGPPSRAPVSARLGVGRPTPDPQPPQGPPPRPTRRATGGRSELADGEGTVVGGRPSRPTDFSRHPRWNLYGSGHRPASPDPIRAHAGSRSDRGGRAGTDRVGGRRPGGPRATGRSGRRDRGG
jgi:hypothetical protein